jgi:hypothetical protein
VTTPITDPFTSPPPTTDPFADISANLNTFFGRISYALGQLLKNLGTALLHLLFILVGFGIAAGCIFYLTRRTPYETSGKAYAALGIVLGISLGIWQWVTTYDFIQTVTNHLITGIPNVLCALPLLLAVIGLCVGLVIDSRGQHW